MADEPTANHLLESEEKSFSDFLIPGVLGLAGAAILYSSFSKNKKKDSKQAAALEVGDQEIKFSQNYTEYAVGKNWESSVLEPFLAELVEDGNLLTLEDAQESAFIGAAGGEEVALRESRRKAIAAFGSVHRVMVGGNSVLLSQLPSGKSGVQKFNEWLDTRVKIFQEEY